MLQKLQLRRLMIKEKSFLKSLSTAKTVKVAKKATDSQVNIVCHILFFIWQGDIPLTPEAVSELSRTRKTKLMNAHFYDFDSFKSLLANESLKRHIVVALKILYRELFYHLFNKK